MQELTGKSAVITGASRGIGAAAATDLAGHGVSVLLLARGLREITDIAAKINADGGKAAAIACDVSHFADVQAAADKCQELFGSFDILINNAGVIEPISRLADSDPEHWGQVVDINYKGVYYGLRSAIPVMRSQGAGVIVNISSGAAVSALEGWSHYCSTKAAVLSLTRCASLEYAGEGIRVIGLSPGTVATGMQVAIKASGVNPVSQMDPSVHIPAEWVAQGISWLCTDDASEFDGTDVSLRGAGIRERIGLPSLDPII